MWFWVLSQFGVVEAIRTFSKHKRTQMFVQYANGQHARSCYSGLNGTEVSGFSPSVIISDKPNVDLEHSTDFTDLNRAIRLGKARSPLNKLWVVHSSDVFGRVGDCVHVAGLLGVEKACQGGGITLPMLWRVAGQYGTLVAGKLLAQGKTGCALLQFQSPQEAETFRKNIQVQKIQCESQKFHLVASKSSKPHCANWANTCQETTILAKETPPPPPSMFPPLPPQRFVTCILPRDSGTLSCLSGNQVPRFSTIHCSANPRLVTVEYESVGDAFWSLAMLNGVGGIVMSFGKEPQPQPHEGHKQAAPAEAVPLSLATSLRFPPQHIQQPHHIQQAVPLSVSPSSAVPQQSVLYLMPRPSQTLQALSCTPVLYPPVYVPAPAVQGTIVSSLVAQVAPAGTAAPGLVTYDFQIPKQPGNAVYRSVPLSF